MNTQEKDSLSRLLMQLGSVKLEQKDSEAEAMIRDACNRQTDASYLLVQRILLLEQALQDAQGRITALHSELEQVRAAPRNGFLDASNWGNSPVAGMPAKVPAQANPQLTSAPAVPWGSSFLGNVATTAAGVVAGSFLFQGIEHLMGNHNSSWFSNSNDRQGAHTESTVINNYYGNDPADGIDSAALADNSDSTEMDSWV